MTSQQIARSESPDALTWWRHAVIYQVYPRSFADGNGDGIGDLPGITSRLPYLAALGVDAVWLSPFYRSPQADAGYDVSDYRDVDPLFGTLDDFDRMLQLAHRLGLRVIVDLVPNHTSDDHAWFREALASPPSSPERKRYLFRDGTGENGERPPNNWQSIFGGRAWSKAPGDSQWYLHLFDRRQPDLDWNHPEVREDFEKVLRFWLDRGVDGFRVDVAHGLIKAEGLPDFAGHVAMVEGSGGAHSNHGPMWDQEGVHDIYRSWRHVLDEYAGDRMMVAEAWVHPPARLARYVRSDEMQQAFNFDYLLTHWNADDFRAVIDRSLAVSSEVGAPTTWVMSNHDTVRHTSRYGLSVPGARPRGIDADGEQPDEALGLRRARAAALLTLALPGSAYLYQGEELGLPEHTTLEAVHRQDPAFFRTGGAEVGRDGCRVPLPWHSEQPGFGFGTGSTTWLPQPASFERYAVNRQEGTAGSTLELYRAVLRHRRSFGLGTGTLAWLASEPGVVAFANGSVRVFVNTNDHAVRLPAGRLVVSSERLQANGQLPANSAVWLAE